MKIKRQIITIKNFKVLTCHHRYVKSDGFYGNLYYCPKCGHVDASDDIMYVKVLEKNMNN